jgi:DNA/RNA-binding domain of Phe-tRNA-synthetase-like protein
MFEGPLVDQRIAAIAPGFCAISIFADPDGAARGKPDPDLFQDACDSVLAGGPAWAEAHLASWREVYRKFGANPNKTPCSAEALRRRVLKEGRLSPISPVVDLYNAVSLYYAIPAGGEKYDAYVGPPYLTIANGDETFDTVMSGRLMVENPAPGEVIWRDDLGVTCRRWNWRQCNRTRLDGFGGTMWFVLEALESMPAQMLEEAANALVDGLVRLMPGCRIKTLEFSATAEFAIR